MKQPTWLDFLLRVGGVFALFAAGILIERALFPGGDSYAVGVVSALIFSVLAIREFTRTKRAKRSRNLRKKFK